MIKKERVVTVEGLRDGKGSVEMTVFAEEMMTE